MEIILLKAGENASKQNTIKTSDSFSIEMVYGTITVVAILFTILVAYIYLKCAKGWSADDKTLIKDEIKPLDKKITKTDEKITKNKDDIYRSIGNEKDRVNNMFLQMDKDNEKRSIDISKSITQAFEKVNTNINDFKKDFNDKHTALSKEVAGLAGSQKQKGSGGG